MLKIEFIYTFKKKSQAINACNGSISVFESKESLSNFATANLSEDDKKQLVKISCAVYSQVDLPNWFLQENGKLWFKNGVIL